MDQRIRTAAPTNPPLLVVPGKSVGLVALDMTQAEVTAVAGQPDRSYGNAWEYLTKGYAVAFSRSTRTVSAIFGGAGCPPGSPLVDAFKGRTQEDVGMHTSRADVLAAFGSPDADRVEAKSWELMTYRRLGIEFTLSKDSVFHVTVRRFRSADQQRLLQEPHGEP